MEALRAALCRSRGSVFRWLWAVVFSRPSVWVSVSGWALASESVSVSVSEMAWDWEWVSVMASVLAYAWATA